MNSIKNILKYSPKRKPPLLMIKCLLSERGKQNLTGLCIKVGQTWDSQKLSLDFNDLGSLGIAGSVGTGKTTFLKSIILTLLHNNPPTELQFIIGSPLSEDFKFIENSKYLQVPVIHNATELLSNLNDLSKLMEDRYKFLDKHNERQIYWYNWHLKMDHLPKSSKPIEYIFFCIDNYELLIKDASKKVRKQIDELIVNILQLGRAAGVYLILSSTDWTDKTLGEAKVYLMNKVCFKTTSKNASEDAIWENGTQFLQSKGDAIISRHGDGGVMLRIQTPTVTKSDELIRTSI